MLNDALDALNVLLEKLKRTLKSMPDLNEQLYNVAFASIGHDLSTVAANEVACAEAVSRIVQKAFPELKFPTIVSTRELFSHLSQSPSFKPVDTPQYGDIILSVTGTGNGAVEHGHTGIMGRTWIMSNDSRSGTFEANYLPDNWRRYYEVKGGFYTHYFRRV